jgi:hypothetical protein
MMLGPTAPYRCCLGGYCCCNCELPRCCLAFEVCFCLQCSIAANRIHIQMARQIANTACDNCIIVRHT